MQLQKKQKIQPLDYQVYALHQLRNLLETSDSLGNN